MIKRVLGSHSAVARLYTTAPFANLLQVLGCHPEKRGPEESQRLFEKGFFANAHNEIAIDEDLGAW